ncbi:MAG: hypothetical protein Q9212_001777 [Teloschistes hypoglaucus]
MFPTLFSVTSKPAKARLSREVPLRVLANLSKAPKASKLPNYHSSRVIRAWKPVKRQSGIQIVKAVTPLTAEHLEAARDILLAFESIVRLMCFIESPIEHLQSSGDIYLLSTTRALQRKQAQRPASSLEDSLPPASPLESNKEIQDPSFFEDAKHTPGLQLLDSITRIPTASASLGPSPRPLEPPSLFPASKNKLPFLDISQAQAAQAGQYWPGATASAPSLAFPLSSTLPTPPTEADVYKPLPEQNRGNAFNVATAAVQQQPSMAATLEPAGAPQSFTARRQAASHLPTFELPPPPSISQKFMSYTALPATQSTPSMVSVGNLLTPPSNIPGDSLSPLSSTISNSGSNHNVQPYTPSGFWPPPSSGPNPFALGTGTPQPWSQSPANPLFPPRGMFSPSLNSLVRNSSTSPSSAEGLPPPPFDVNQLPPFPGSMSISGPSNLPPVPAHQHQALAQAYMAAQSPVSAPTTQASPVNASESFAPRPPPTPYYSGSQASSTPQNNQFSPYHAPSSAQQSPSSASTAQGSRISPINAHNPTGQPPTQPQGPGFPRNYGAPYPLPGMPVPILTNVHSPGHQMTMIGMPGHGLPGNIMPGYHSGSSAQMQQMYGAHQQPQHNERPFKCDQCPQSFNRNHDLKRHKRIHLAVKPFPCGHCEKSFSRKDALKVRMMAFR